jgi:hypothetical protein
MFPRHVNYPEDERRATPGYFYPPRLNERDDKQRVKILANL